MNSERLMKTLETLGRIGESPEGMQRLAFTPADVEGRKYVTTLMTRAGLEVRVDPAGNIIGRVEGKEPGLSAIALGSHTDTVPSGGKYDGALGVLGAIECVQSLRDQSITTRRPIEVLDFTNEEGTRFRRWLYGSRAMAGVLESDDLTAVDDEGVTIGRRLEDVGGDISRIQEARRQKGDLCAYLELHIEQGPVLHQAGIPIGVVTAITGRIALEVSIIGFANHAGTTPMTNRRDALLTASRIIQAVNSIATHEEICRVGTVGMAKVSPNAENVIPGRVDLSVEFRDVELDRLHEAVHRLNGICQQLVLDKDFEIKVSELGVTKSAPMSPRLREIIEKASLGLGLNTTSLPSGAGHDAQSMAEITDVGMIFVPSVDGISHSPKEYSDPEACANGANVLLNSLLAIDGEGD
ncbi:MAG: Zn-dependent hydrolase [Chloroflexi bacterium]|nr:Zn-dependent hydrolase [Chloroflexota bacterium]